MLCVEDFSCSVWKTSHVLCGGLLMLCVEDLSCCVWRTYHVVC